MGTYKNHLYPWDFSSQKERERLGQGGGGSGCEAATVMPRPQVGFSKQLLCQVSTPAMEPEVLAFLAAPCSSAPLGACQMALAFWNSNQWEQWFPVGRVKGLHPAPPWVEMGT